MSTLPVSVTNDDLPALLHDVVQRFGSFSALAQRIGMSANRVTRIAQGQGSMEVENCLKLAAATGVSASRVLRAAGKAEIDTLIATLYGPATPSLSADAAQLLSLFAGLRDPLARTAALEAVEYVARLAAEAESRAARVQALAAEVARLESLVPRRGDTGSTAPPTPMRTAALRPPRRSK